MDEELSGQFRFLGTFSVVNFVDEVIGGGDERLESVKAIDKKLLNPTVLPPSPTNFALLGSGKSSI